jgi:hypothetical protein
MLEYIKDHNMGEFVNETCQSTLNTVTWESM